jgi:hypothetical protein
MELFKKLILVINKELLKKFTQNKQMCDV